MWHTLQDHERSRFQDAGAKSSELIPASTDIIDHA
jgi:hypothetical protein